MRYRTICPVDKVEIQWPSGKKQVIAVSDVDRIFVVDEEKGLLP